MKMKGHTPKWKRKVSTEREKIKSSLEVVVATPRIWSILRKRVRNRETVIG